MIKGGIIQFIHAQPIIVLGFVVGSRWIGIFVVDDVSVSSPFDAR